MGRIVDTQGIHIYRVKEVNGNELYLAVENTGVAGWTTTDQIVPVEQAVDFFTECIRARPRDPYGFSMRAMIWEGEKEFDLAMDDYNKAVKLNPRQSYVYVNRSLLWSAQKKYDRVLVDLNQAIRLSPVHNDGAYQHRGTVWMMKLEYDKAIADFGRAIEIDPSNLFALNFRCKHFTRTRTTAKSLADSNKVIRLDPKNNLAYFGRAWIWSDMS